MAFESLENIRTAELNASKRIERARQNANEAEASAKRQADEIIYMAKENANLYLKTERDKAQRAAEELIDEAKINAISKAAATETLCRQKQSAVNKRILEIILKAEV